MTSWLRVFATVFLSVVSAFFVAAPGQALPLVPGSPGQNCAAGYMADPNSGNCWQMTDKGSPTVGGGPCLPGRVGTCLGYLQNNPYAPGDTLPGNNNSW